MGREEKQQTVGILGGTFDPVHKGHLEVARTVLSRYQLDRIIFIPAFSPPHKDRNLAPFSHRVAMLEEALEGNDNMSVSILEAERDTPSYTVETLQELHLRMESCTFFLIMGADMFVEIELWYRYRELFKMAHFIVAARPGISRGRVASQIARLPGEFSYDSTPQMWTRNDGFKIFYYADIAESISSSAIRSLLAEGSSVAEYLTAPVREYIKQHGLYRNSGSSH